MINVPFTSIEAPIPYSSTFTLLFSLFTMKNIVFSRDPDKWQKTKGNKRRQNKMSNNLIKTSDNMGGMKIS